VHTNRNTLDYLSFDNVRTVHVSQSIISGLSQRQRIIPSGGANRYWARVGGPI
jgi:hypothetical protein